jgi:hypothetical protein
MFNMQRQTMVISTGVRGILKAGKCWVFFMDYKFERGRAQMKQLQDLPEPTRIIKHEGKLLPSHISIPQPDGTKILVGSYRLVRCNYSRRFSTDTNLYVLTWKLNRYIDFVGVAAVPLVGLDPLARLEEVTQHFVKYINVGILTGRVRPLDPHQVPREDVHPQLIVQGGLPRILMGREGVPLRRGSLLGDAEVRALHGHRAVVEHVMRAQPALEDNLRRGGGRRRRG